MFDVVALGEILIDFTPYGSSEGGRALFEQNPGGAPANVLAALAKLERRTCLLYTSTNYTIKEYGNWKEFPV